MGNGKSALKVFVDEKKRKVMFAEAEEDFIEILFGFFTLPLGTIARLSTKHADANNHTKVGSLSSLYQSLVNLDVRHFSEVSEKSKLVNPINASAPVCQRLKVNLDDNVPLTCYLGEVFLKKKAKFMITDDLKVIPVVLDTSIELLNTLGVDYIDSLLEKTIYFGSKEFLNLLKWSLMSNNPLTNVVFGGSIKPRSTLLENANSTLSDSANSCKTQTVKLLVQKSKEKVLCAQVDNRFVELLFSFLTIPLGAYERLTKNGSSTTLGISNLFQSISCLGDGDYFKSEAMKTIILHPMVSRSYSRVTDLLPIYGVERKEGAFLKEQATFIVSDDLKVTSSPSIATISKFNIPGVPIGDMELLDLSIGEQDAILLLKASLMSSSALTDWLKLLLMKKPKGHVPNIDLAGDGGKDLEDEADETLKGDNRAPPSLVMVD